MSKYEFYQIYSAEYNQDLVFSSKQFNMFGTAGVYNSPLLFCVDKYRYVIINPFEIKSNQDLLFKIGAYLYHNPHNINGLPVTYFFGDISKCEDVSSGFDNQIVKIVSYEMVEEWYPKTLNEINNKIVSFFLNKQKFYGQVFVLNDEYDYNYLFFVSKTLGASNINQGITFIRKQLFDKKLFIQKSAYDNQIDFILSEFAVDTYQPTQINKSKYAFIAIKFYGNEERIQSIQKAIVKAGYIPVIMNELEHNNWIMPEIFHQIQISEFVVVDLSIRCDGAYYEAGYAHALGKEVIHTYDITQKNSNPLHFDVAQKSTIMYESLNELEIKLYNRIVSTIK